MLVSPFYKLSKTRQKIQMVLLFIFTVVMVFIMRFFDSYLKNEVAPNGIVSFELAKKLSKSQEILNSWGEIASVSAQMSMTFDFLFLVIYVFFISLIIHRLNEAVWKKSTIYKIGIVLIYAVFIAGFFDIIENIALLRLLSGDFQQIWSSVAYYFAVMKFGLLGLGLVFVLISLLKLGLNKINFSSV